MATKHTYGLETATFLPSAVSAETAGFNQTILDATAQAPPISEVPLELMRSGAAAGSLPGAVTSPETSTKGVTRVVSANGLEVPVRVVVPPEVRGIYFHIHGGGWTIGRAEQADIFNIPLAEALKVAVVSVDYRLAPENPYPAAPDDCEAAAAWLIEHAKAEFGTDSIIIGGESGGAHLSAVTLLRMRDRHGFRGFVAANLVCGGYDLTLTPSAHNWGAKPGILNTNHLEWFINNFVPPERRAEPDVSPMRADLSDLPPAFFTIGTLDPLLDDSLFMYARWLASGNEAEIFVAPGGVHGFTLFPLKIGKDALDRANEYLGACLDERGGG
jgi:acetyl esterase/lipase